MNSIADVDDYDSFNFHYPNKYEQLRPLQLTTKNHVYSLLVNEKGIFVFSRVIIYSYINFRNEPVSPPRLREKC